MARGCPGSFARLPFNPTSNGDDYNGCHPWPGANLHIKLPSRYVRIEIRRQGYELDMLFIPTAFALVALCTTRRAQAQGPYTFKDCKYVDIVKNHVISAFCPASDNFDNSYTSNIVNGTTKNGIVQGKFTLMDLDLCLGRQEHVLTAQAECVDGRTDEQTDGHSGGGLDGATGCHLTEPPDVKLVDCVGTNGFTADPFVLGQTD